MPAHAFYIGTPPGIEFAPDSVSTSTAAFDYVTLIRQ